MRKKDLYMTVTLLTTVVSCSGCSTDTSLSGNIIVGQQSSAAQAEETVEKGTDASNEKEASAQDGGNEIINVSDYLIGYSQLTNTRTYWVAKTDSMKDKVEKRGFRLIVMDAQDNTTRQVSDVEDLITQNTDLPILSLREFEGLETALQTVKRNSIPVVLVDKLAKGKAGVDYVAYVTADFVWGEQTVGEWFKGKIGGTCDIIEFIGIVRSSSAQDRATGLTDAMDQNEGMKIIVSQTGNFGRPEGQKIVENLLQAHRSEVGAVLYRNDRMALGAAQAIKAAGHRPNEDILVIGIDGGIGSSESITTRETSATVVSSPMYGPIIFDTIEEILTERGVPKQTITEGVAIDAGNAQGSVELVY